MLDLLTELTSFPIAASPIFNTTFQNHMKGLIFDIKHYAIHDGPGIRQTIFFKGCPLSCWWCHNPESQSSRVETYTKKKRLDGRLFEKQEKIGYYIEADELFRIIESDTIFYDESAGGVTFSGGEPLMQPQFLEEIAQKSHRAKIHTALDTSGYASQRTLLKVLEYIDLVLYDLKIIDDGLHRRYTGVSNKVILENLELLNQSGKDVRVRFPVIPGITDTSTNLQQVQSYLSQLNQIKNIDILDYHDISRGKYERFGKENKMGDQKPGPGVTEEIKKQFENLGYQVSIGG